MATRDSNGAEDEGEGEPVPVFLPGPLSPGAYVAAPAEGCLLTLIVTGGGGGGGALSSGGGAASYAVTFFSDGVTPFVVSIIGKGGRGSEEAVARCKAVGVRVTGMRRMSLGLFFDVNVHGGL